MFIAPSPRSWWLAVVASERGRESVRRSIADCAGDVRHGEIAVAQVVAGEGHSPVGQVLHGSLAEGAAKGPGEGCSGQAADRGEFGDRPGIAKSSRAWPAGQR